MSSKNRTVQTFGILCIHAYWEYIINILVILIGPNRLGVLLGVIMFGLNISVGDA